MKIRISPSFLFLIMFLTLVIPFTVAPTPVSASNRKLDLAIKFLASRYNDTVGLVQQSPNIQPNIYWIISDGLYAYHALKPHLPDLAQKIYDGMAGFHEDGFHEVFWKSVPWPIPFMRIEKSGIGGAGTNLYNISNAEVWINFFDDTSGYYNDENMWDYADMICARALVHYHNGHYLESRQLFKKMLDENWDGVGINDTVSHEMGFYSTYKLAFVIVTANIIKADLPDRSLMEGILWKAQVLEEDNPPSLESWKDNRIGGLYAAYMMPLQGTFKFYTDAACEMTSLAIIAENTKPPSADGAYSVITFNDIILIAVVLGIFATFTIFAVMVRRR